MFCRNCGTENPNDAVFCCECGYRIGNLPVSEPEVAPAVEPEVAPVVEPVNTPINQSADVQYNQPAVGVQYNQVVETPVNPPINIPMNQPVGVQYDRPMGTPVNQPYGVHNNQPVNSQYNQPQNYGGQYNQPTPQYNQPQYYGGQYSQPVPQYNQHQYYGGQYSQPATQYSQPASTPAKPKKKGRVIGIIVSLLAVILLGVAGFFGYEYFIVGNEVETVAKEFAIAGSESDLKSAFKYLHFDGGKFLEDIIKHNADSNGTSISEYYDDIEKTAGVTINDLDDYLEYSHDKKKELLREEYGDYKISAEIISKEKIDEKELEDFKEELIDDFGDNKEMDISDYLDADEFDEIKQGYVIKLKLIIDGDKKSKTEEIALVVAKYDGEWKVINADEE